MGIVFQKSNRIIYIESPATEVTIQELVYAIRNYEDSTPGMDIFKIADASGKEDLGGGVQVGITLKLINWKLKFADRPGPDTIVCNVTGGNLVAVDDAGNFINPIEPSTFVTVTKTSSASATIASLEITNLQYLIESLRPSHRGTGDVFYWNPQGGDDGAVGTKPETAKATFAAAQGLCTDYHDDVIIAMAGNATGETISTEKMVVTVPGIRVRGPGRGLTVQPTGTGSMCWIAANDVEMNGLIFDGAHMSASIFGYDHPYSTNGIGVVNVNNVKIKDVAVINIPGTPIGVSGSFNSNLENVHIGHCSGSAIVLWDGVDHIIFNNIWIHDVKLDGIKLSGSIDHARIDNKSIIEQVGGYGIVIGAESIATMIADDTTISFVGSASYFDLGRGTHFGGLDHSPSYGGYIYYDSVNGFSGSEYPAGTPSRPVNNHVQLMDVSRKEQIYAMRIKNGFNINHNMDNWIFEGITSDASIEFTTGNSADGAIFRSLTMTGSLQDDDFITLENCNLNGISNFLGNAYNCGILGNISLDDGESTFINSYSTVIEESNQPPYVDMIKSGSYFYLRNHNGGIKLKNMTSGSQFTAMSFGSGKLLIDSTVVSGTVNIGGSVNVINNSTANEDALTINQTGVLINYPFTLGNTIYIDEESGLGVSGSAYPKGTSNKPINNIIDAKIAADDANIAGYVIRGEIALHEEHSEWEFVGVDTLQKNIVHLNNQIINDSRFTRIFVSGSMSGSLINIIEGIVKDVDNFGGIILNSAMDGEIGLGGIGTALLGKDLNSISSPTTINMKGIGRVAKFDGGGDYRFISASALCQVQVGLSYGSVEFDSSCIGGSALVRGTGRVIDNSTGMLVDDRTMDTGSISTGIWTDEIAQYTASVGTTGYTLANTSSGSVSIDVDSVVNGVWNATASLYQETGSMGRAIYDISESINDIQVDTGSIAEGVWKETLTQYTSSVDSAGATLYDISQNLSVSGSSPAAIATAVWDEVLSSHTGSEGSAASRLGFILGLVQSNFTMTNQVYDANNNMTSAVLKIFTNGADATAGTNPSKTYSLTATYDGSGNLIDYKVVE